MAGEDDREDRDKGLSNLAEGYRKVAPYWGASLNLAVSVGAFTAGGIWLDRKLENTVPWFTIAGAIVGMTGGFISFFRIVLKDTKRK